MRALLDQARAESWSAEKLLDEILKVGDTLRYAKMTFGGYAVAGLVAAVVVALAAW
jgi:hypothetical protein